MGCVDLEGTWVRFIFAFKNFGHRKREGEVNMDQGEEFPRERIMKWKTELQQTLGLVE
jgi:hypothetical protein